MRHKWGQPVRPDAHNTLRICAHCDLRKITRHESEHPFHWTEFYRADGSRVFYGDGDTPPCGVMGKGLPAADPVLAEAMA